MKYIFILSLFLTSCTKVYQEVWLIEKYPVEWDEEIVIQSEHEHIKQDNNWKCVYYDKDTIIWHHYDTIEVRTLEKRQLIK